MKFLSDLFFLKRCIESFTLLDLTQEARSRRQMPLGITAMPTTETAEQLPDVHQPKHPMHALTTYELRDHRRELEHAIAFYRKHHPAAPVLTDLRARLELSASLALTRPGSPARVPVLARLSAIETELAARSARRGPGGAPWTPGVSLCSCGFGTDDRGWFDGHLFQHPGHYQR
jgi:hypothetical protein